MAAAQLLGHNNARVGPPSVLPVLVERSKVPNIESKDGACLLGRVKELFSRLGESGMRLLFLSDQCHDIALVIEKITESMVYLGFGQPQSVGDLPNRFATKVECSHVTDRNAEAIY